jgi:hypothetical protein
MVVVAKDRRRLALSKEITNRFHMERFSLKKLSEVQGKELYHIEISDWFIALGNLNAEEFINTAWETIRENIKISAREPMLL